MKRLTFLLTLTVTFGCAGAAQHDGAHTDADRGTPIAAGDALPALADGPPTRWPADLPRRGAIDAPVLLVVFTDLQCPFCARLAPTLEQLLQERPDEIAVVMANNPLSFHRQAKRAALTALAAHRQGRYWEMVARINANYRQLSPAWLDAEAERLGLDMQTYRADLDRLAQSDVIGRQQALAASLGARGTPSTFINGKLLSGAQPIAVFHREIDAALARHRELAGRGLRGGALLEASWRAADPVTGPKLLRTLLYDAPMPPADRVFSQQVEPVALPWMGPSLWKIPVDPARDPIWGDNENAEVTWVVFSELQCPFCHRLQRTLRALEPAYRGKIRIVWKNLPLPFHAQAKDAAVAALAAHRQGKFWPFVDACVDGGKLDDAGLRATAGQLGLDIDRWDADRRLPELAQQVEDDMALAKSLGVRGTPTNFLNGIKRAGALPAEQWKAPLEAALAVAAGRRGQLGYEAIVAGGKSNAAVRGPSGDGFGALSGLGSTIDLGAREVRHDLFLIADLDTAAGRVAVQNGIWAARQRGARAAVRILPRLGPTPRSRERALLLLWTARNRPALLLDLLALMVSEPEASSLGLVEQVGRGGQGFELQEVRAAEAGLEQDLVAQGNEIDALGLPGMPAVLVDGRPVEHERGHLGSEIYRLLR
ncbi:MAG: thioredoxin domain-containing protein [Deltaproteobacteria bacterium]|nr:thioredoxin domain-containing protein [Deltaproteobacteria bacterium]